MGSKKVVILFPDAWLAYSPTIINLTRILCQNNYTVEIITFKQIHQINEVFPKEVKVKILPLSSRYKIITKGFYSLVKSKQLFYHYVFGKTIAKNQFGAIFQQRKSYLFKREIGGYSSSTKIIAVDNIATAAATRVRKDVHMLSLEIVKDKFFEKINWNHISSLVIQSKERADFFDQKLKASRIFYIQNSPNFVENLPLRQHGNKLLYFGTLYRGVFKFIDFLRTSDKYSLVLKIKLSDHTFNILEEYKDLIEAKRLVIDKSYIKDEDIITYISQFDIGLLFYSEQMKKDFNVRSSPAGKLFNYYNAGVPIIGDNLVGFNSIEKFEAGLLLDNFNAENVLKASDRIMNNYDFYAQNARKAAKAFDFHSMARPYVDYLDKELNETA